MRQWTFLLGPGLIPRINALFLGSSPRLIPAIGLVGAPLILASATGTIFGAWDHSTIRAAGPCRSPCGSSASASTYNPSRASGPWPPPATGG